jgi:hypothetical protein
MTGDFLDDYKFVRWACYGGNAANANVLVNGANQAGIIGARNRWRNNMS